jgi:hypothetical protein
MLTRTEQDKPEAFAVIDSGNGLQLLYRLEGRIEIAGHDVIVDVEPRSRALTERFGAKPGAQNIDADLAAASRRVSPALIAMVNWGAASGQ